MAQEYVSSEEKLAQIDAAPVTASLHYFRNRLWEIHVQLPHADELAGEVDDDPHSLMMYRLSVNPEVRRHGVAMRLVSGLAHVAMEQGVTAMYTHAESQHTVRVFRRLFGEDNLHFTDYDRETQQRFAVPMNPDQAIASLEQMEQFEDDPEHRKLGFTMIADLSNVPLDSLEAPEIL